MRFPIIKILMGNPNLTRDGKQNAKKNSPQSPSGNKVTPTSMRTEQSMFCVVVNVGEATQDFFEL
jgi:hypothetical protein